MEDETFIEEIEAELLGAVITKLRLESVITSDEGQNLTGSDLFGINSGVRPEVAEYTSRLLLEEISRYNSRAARTNRPLLPQPELSRQRMFDRLFRLGKLQPLLDDPQVEEIIVDSPEKVFIILSNNFTTAAANNGDSRAKKGPNKQRIKLRFRDNEEVLSIVKRIAATAGRHVDEANPLLDLQLPGGERLHVVIPPVSRNVAVTIRKHSQQINSLEELVKRGTLSRPAATFLSACVAAHLNILVSGGTATGKTSMLNCLGSKIDSGERVVVIEETAELQIERVVSDTVAMQARPANIEGKGEISLGDLVRNSLRMRPSWIVVGEVRGAEALMMLLALTSGHAGMATVHADNPKAALTRLKTLAGMARESPQEQVLTDLIVGAIQIVICLKHDPSTGRRLVSSIWEVSGQENGQPLGNEIFALRQLNQAVREGSQPYLYWTGTMPRCFWQLEEVGLDWERQITASQEQEIADLGGKEEN